MRINNFTVSGYTGRMALNQNNKTLHMKIDADTQILIGSNGSGKSSLIALLQLCIPKGSDFDKDGYVSHEIEHNGKQYYLNIAYKTAQGICSFKELRGDEWVELNGSRNVKTQKDLIAQVFGITPVVQSLLSGKDAFTDMSLPKRRQWFVSMSQSNYDYAIGVYMRIKDAHRDVQGFIKRSKEHLTRVQADRLNEADLSAMLLKQKMLQNDIVTLLTHSSPNRFSKQTLQSQIRSLLNDIEKITAAKYAPVHTPVERYDPYTLDGVITGLITSIEDTSHRRRRIFNAWQDLSSSLKAVTDVGAENAQGLRDEQLRLIEAIAELRCGIKHALTVSNADAAYALYLRTKQALLESIFALPSNPDERYSANKLNALSQRLTGLRQAERMANIHLANVKAEIASELKTIADHQTTCPSCEHRYIH